MKEYICIECSQTYTAEDKPKDSVCRKRNCPGNGILGLIIENETKPTSPPPQKSVPDKAEIPDEGKSPNKHQPIVDSDPPEIGLCVLLMDASGSMFEDAAFKDQSFPSSFGNKFLNKAEMVAKCASNAIFTLRNIALKPHQEAYIMAIKFDNKQSLMFNNKIGNIIEEYKSPEDFAKYLYNELDEMKGGTNINEALNIAYNYVEKFKNGFIPGIGDFEPMIDSIFLPNKEGDYEIPNIRVMLYTDGEHTHSEKLSNPFQADDPDLLMAAFIGSSEERGCKQLRKIISRCPIHDSEQFFVIDKPTSQATLRKLFRMASDASGFCPKCIPQR